MDDKFFEYLKETLGNLDNQYLRLKKIFPHINRQGEFMTKFLPVYLAYRSEQHSRRLVLATWALAISTIALTIITFIIK